MSVSDPNTATADSLRKFLSKLAHDLRTPINHIIGYTEMLLEGIEETNDEEGQKLVPDLQRVLISGREIVKFINDELTMEKIQGSGVSLNQVLKQLRDYARMPLDQIIGYSEILRTDAEGQQVLADLQKINAAGKRLLTVIDDNIEITKAMTPLSMMDDSQEQPPEPRRQAKKEAPEPVEGDAVGAGDKGTILVVDDNEINRDMLSRRLQREGYVVALAEDGQQALQMLNKQKFDLVLLDIMMPGMSGLEMLSIIRKTRSVTELPIIMATAKGETDDIVEGLYRGANDYVTKPIDPQILLARLETHLRVKRLSQLKDEFLRIASHDLKNPLATILLSANIVYDHIKPGVVMTEQAHQMLSFIVKRGDEMSRIIRDFLDFQAAEDGKLKLERTEINLNEIAQSLIETNADYALGKEISLIAEFDDSLPSIQADSARLSQVIQNFVGNAIKFGSKDDQVVIRTFTDQDSVILQVSDTGPGLKPEDMSRVFMKYARLSNKPTGGENSSGLGLAICKQMVELHGGKIGVFNNSDRGATFWFSLPINA